MRENNRTSGTDVLVWVKSNFNLLIPSYCNGKGHSVSRVHFSPFFEHRKKKTRALIARSVRPEDR